MILATVITCPQRWSNYQKLRRDFERLSLRLTLRTFQCPESLNSPFINNILNARAAIQYAARRLQPPDWLLYLEDDVELTEDLARVLPLIEEIGAQEQVDCWYLCNRKNEIQRQWPMQNMVLNELDYLPKGAHALLLPQRHLQPILDAHWGDLSDQSIFRALGREAKIWQVVHPLLAKHTGEISTFNSEVRQNLEINTCN